MQRYIEINLLQWCSFFLFLNIFKNMTLLRRNFYNMFFLTDIYSNWAKISNRKIRIFMRFRDLYFSRLRLQMYQLITRERLYESLGCIVICDNVVYATHLNIKVNKILPFVVVIELILFIRLQLVRIWMLCTQSPPLSPLFT